MQLANVRFLFGYDRWATRKVLEAAVAVDAATWAAPNAIGERGLGEILVHTLSSHEGWRNGLSGSPAQSRPENEPLLTVGALLEAWATEWAALDAWLESLDDAAMDQAENGVPYWQMLTHVVNHGTQHRSEAAALLTAAGRSPGDLDLIDYSDTLASPTS